MIKGFVQGQTLKLAQTRVVADTIDYLIAKFHFQGEDWRGLEKWMHLQQGEQLYVIKLTEDRTQKSDHLNLSAGEWAVWLHGNETVNGSVTQRITTNVCAFTVERSGALDGDAMPELPAGLGEQLQARVAALEGEEAELPLISEGDEGKVLMASGGQWIAADAPRGDSDIEVDAALSATSENPVQNKVIAQEFAALYQGVGASMEELSRRVTPEVTAEDNGRVLTVVDGAWAAAEASSGGGSSAGEVPTFDLTALGLETVSIGGFATLETDTTEIMAALDRGPVKFILNMNMEGEVRIGIVVTSMSGDGIHLCMFTMAGDALSSIMIQVMPGGLAVIFFNYTEAMLPNVTVEQNGKILQVVEGKWQSVAVAESAIKTYIDDYINEALGGDY